jgi:hypothetical protein
MLFFALEILAHDRFIRICRMRAIRGIIGLNVVGILDFDTTAFELLVGQRKLG